MKELDVVSLDEFSVLCSNKGRAEDRPTPTAVLGIGENPLHAVE